MKKLLLTAIIVLLTAFPLSAQINWTKLDGPYGGRVDGIHEDVTGRLYAYGNELFYSDDKGENWQELELPKSYRTIQIQHIFTNGKMIYLNIYEFDNNSYSWQYILQSSDLGATWKENDTFPMFTDYLKKTDGNYLIGDYRLFEYNTSTDELKLLNKNINSDGNSSGLQNFVKNAKGDLFTGYKGLLRSTDGGYNFELLSLDDVFINSICITGNNTILVSNYEMGILRSTDNGESWSHTINDGSPVIKMITAGDGIILALTEYNGIYRSTDDGKSWNFYSLKAYRATDMIQSEDNSIYVSNAYHGIYKSPDNGLNWEPKCKGISNIFFSSIEFDSNNNIYGGSIKYGAFRSADLGKNWDRILDNLNTYGTNVNSVAINSKGYVYATGYSVVYRSKSKGLSWDSSSFYTFDEDYAILKIDKDDNIFLCDSRFIYKSTDDGDSWTIITPEWSISPKTLFVDSEGDLYVNVPSSYDGSGSPSGIAHSSDKGISWNLFTPSFIQFGNLLMAEDKDGILYFYGNDGFYKSYDNGSNMALVYKSHNWSNRFLKIINNTIYLIFKGGAYISGNKGVTWDSVSWNLEGNDYVDFDVDSSGYFYLTTGKSIYKSDRVMNVNYGVKNDDNILIDFYQDQSKFHVILESSNSQNCEADVYNFLGIKTDRIFVGTLNSHKEFTINTENYQSGIYFIKICSDNYLKTIKFIVMN